MNHDAIRHFESRLAFETDVADVAGDLAAGRIVLVDSRGREGWDQGHVPGALHIPTALIPATALVPPDAAVVTYCWGPGCNGATRAALAFARRGFRVREMIGGFEYWAREGFPVETGDGAPVHRPADPLTAPVRGAACGC